MTGVKGGCTFNFLHRFTILQSLDYPTPSSSKKTFEKIEPLRKEPKDSLGMTTFGVVKMLDLFVK